MKRLFFTIGLGLICASSLFAKDYVLQSPDQQSKVVVQVTPERGILATVYYLDKVMLTWGPIGMKIYQGESFGDSPRVRRVNTSSVTEEILPVVREKRAVIPDHYNEMELIFREPFRLVFRMYNDGAAYRIKTDLTGEVVVANELGGLSFPADELVYYPTDVSYFTHSERSYELLKLSEINEDKMASTPFLMERADGISLLVTEADLEDYPGMYVRGVDGDALRLDIEFPPYVLETRQSRDRDVKPEKVADYIAKTQGGRYFPWRAVAYVSDQKEILDHDLVYRLAAPSRIADPSWIKPGKVAWDWWNANNNRGVDFRSGVNTETYMYHIDFAAEYGLDYIILDEGWSVPADLFALNPEVDMEKICSYAQSKGVGVILWVLWNALDKDLERALEQFSAWGVKGIKVDFMQRDDQWMVNYYWRISEAAARYQMLVDFHGAYKPCGLRRTWPNMITREGVKGLEHNKWSEDISPDHDCTLPFIRQFVGPMDYTPGAMRNAEKANFKAAFTRPMSQGTRAHQLALYVIFVSPLQMQADAPSNYYREKETMNFLATVPTTWDETVPLAGKVGDYVAVARKSGDDWYLGVITDWQARDMELNLDFLPEGSYRLTEWKDGINADRFAEDLGVEERIVKTGDKLSIRLAPGGGYAARLSRN